MDAKDDANANDGVDGSIRRIVVYVDTNIILWLRSITLPAPTAATAERAGRQHIYSR